MSVNNVAMSASMPFGPGPGRAKRWRDQSVLAIVDGGPKYVLVDHGRDPEPWWFPSTSGSLALARRSLSWLSLGPLGRVQALSLLGAMRARLNARQSFMRERQLIRSAEKLCRATE